MLLVAGTTSIDIPIVKRGVVDFAVGADWSPAAGDCKVDIDGAGPTNITNLPTAVTSGNTAKWRFILTAAELSGKKIDVTISDAATKLIEDQMFTVETFGNASAMYQQDFSASAFADSAGVTTLLSRLSATRAGYLDNLSAGAVALEASLQGLITTIGAAAAGVATAVWSAVTRTLTAGTNIVLAKGVGVTGFNDLSAAQVNTEADTALADVGVTTTVTGRIDAAISTRLATAGYTAPLDAAGVRSAVGLAAANLDTQLDALPTNSELATSQAAADDATLAAIAALNNPSAAAIASAVHTHLQSGTPVLANVKQVNDVDLQGDGTLGNEWIPS